MNYKWSNDVYYKICVYLSVYLCITVQTFPGFGSSKTMVRQPHEVGGSDSYTFGEHKPINVRETWCRVTQKYVRSNTSVLPSTLQG